jgi:hypothetical protein
MDVELMMEEEERRNRQLLYGEVEKFRAAVRSCSNFCDQPLVGERVELDARARLGSPIALFA